MSRPVLNRVPSDQSPEEYYRELTTRHQHFVSPKAQARLSELKVLVAGCGSTGGACIESLARLGIQNFALADNGTYELNNLNRQHALLENIGQNKAEFHASQVKGINPYANVQVCPEGIGPRSAEKLVQWADIVIDAVDVTTPTGMTAKLLLHVHAHGARKPVFTALDLGFLQYGKSYDYRHSGTRLLGGRYEAARTAQHPLKALFAIVPLSKVPAHVLPLAYDLMTKSGISASQLGATSDLLSSLIVAAMIRFAEDGSLVRGWSASLESIACSPLDRARTLIKGIWLRRQVKRLIANAA